MAPKSDNRWQEDLVRRRDRERTARAVLGVSDSAGREEIRRAFHRGVLACHPDRTGGDAAKNRQYRLICCAYRFLVSGEWCPELDQCQGKAPMPADDRYRLDNPWGYWCWWREHFFEDFMWGRGFRLPSSHDRQKTDNSTKTKADS